MPAPAPARRIGLVTTALVTGAVLVACTSPVPTDADLVDATPTPSATPEALRAEVHAPQTEHTVLDTLDPVALATQTSKAFYASAPVAVVAPSGDPAAAVRAASAAVTLGAPLLLAAPAGTDDGGLLAAELTRLGAEAVLAVGDVAPGLPADVSLVLAPADDDALAALLDADLTTTTVAPGDEVVQVAALDRAEPTLLSSGELAADGADRADGADAPEGEEAGGTEDASAATADPTTTDEPTAPSGTADRLPSTEHAEPLDGPVLLTTGAVEEIAPVATARAAGLDVVVVPSADPRSTSATVQAMAAAAPTHVVALGAGFGTPEVLASTSATAATGVELPGGGQVLFPGRRFVALYGTPVTSALGILGEQGLEASISRAQGLASEYQELTEDVVVPAFEIIVTVASAGAGDDGNYSNELPVEDFVPWVEAARDAGVYVVLDLQPGRTDFLTQAKQYEQLLRYPNVGLALDPEWRLGPDEKHMVRIGSVDVAEVNAVAEWLAAFTRENALPQKLLVLHQFQLGMITGREQVDTSLPEVSVLIHVDGQGSQGAKAGTWATLQRDAPPNVTWGWKNFIDEDSPMLTPEQTYQVTPLPAFVSYQ